MTKGVSTWAKDLGRLALMWAVAVAIAAVWVIADQKPPAWDQAEHLSLAMNYWWTLTHSDLS